MSQKPPSLLGPPASDPLLPGPDPPPTGPWSWLGALADYWALTKPEVNFLVVVSTLAGFDLAWRGPMDWTLLLNTLLGTLLVASGTGTLNQYIERRSDALMRRTARRPLPAGRLRPEAALIYGLFLALAGGGLLWTQVNHLTSVLALLTLTTYLLFYTPLKRKTPLCTLVGAFPGAMPPVIGWAAARGALSLEAGTLYAILFLWQFPHLLSIAWMYREDYSRAGLRLLPAGDHDGRITSRRIMACLLALVPLSLLPEATGQMGRIYLAGALLLGLYFLAYGLRLARARTNRLARQLVLASIAYLPLVFGLMIFDKGRM
jgi:protoheme IX farnesyltransferase